MKDPSYRFFAGKWLGHNQFMGIGNPLEVEVHYLLIRGITSLIYSFDNFYKIW